MICYNMDYRPDVTFTPLKIENCNAFSTFGTSFSKAYCDTKPYEARLMFGSLFHNGLSILRDYEETKKVPTDRKTLFVFNKLMDFLNGGEKNENYIFYTIIINYGEFQIIFNMLKLNNFPK